PPVLSEDLGLGKKSPLSGKPLMAGGVGSAPPTRAEGSRLLLLGLLAAFFLVQYLPNAPEPLPEQRVAVYRGTAIRSHEPSDESVVSTPSAQSALRTVEVPSNEGGGVADLYGLEGEDLGAPALGSDRRVADRNRVLVDDDMHLPLPVRELHEAGLLHPHDSQLAGLVGTVSSAPVDVSHGLSSAVDVPG